MLRRRVPPPPELPPQTPPEEFPLPALPVSEAEQLTHDDIVIDARSGRVRQAGATQAEGSTIMDLKARAEQSLFTFAKFILGRKRLTPHLHGRLARRIQRVPPRRKTFLLPMGTFKTTLISQALPMHMHIQAAATNPYWPGLNGSEMRVMLGCETQDLASSRLRWVSSQWETNKLLRAFWPHKCWDRPMSQAKKWNETEIILPREVDYPEPSMHALGVDGAFIGYHYNVLLKDDIIALKASNSPTLMQTAYDWHLASRTRLSPDEDLGLEFIIGTRWAPNDVYERIQEEDPTVEMETHALVEDGVPLFPEAFPLEKIAKLQEEEKAMFWLWRMNSTANPELVDFDLSQLRTYELKREATGKFLLFPEDDRDIKLGQVPPSKSMEEYAGPKVMNRQAWDDLIQELRADGVGVNARMS